MLSGNIGEWSEIYTFFKLLADGKLHAANADLTLDPTSYYPIVKIIRQQKDFTFEYVFDETSISISKDAGTAPIRTIARKCHIGIFGFGQEDSVRNCQGDFTASKPIQRRSN